MAPETLRALLAQLTTEIRERADRSAAVARAAQACSEAGDAEQAVSILLDIEQPIYEMTTLLNAASLMNRTVRD